MDVKACVAFILNKLYSTQKTKIITSTTVDQNTKTMWRIAAATRRRALPQGSKRYLAGGPHSSGESFHGFHPPHVAAWHKNAGETM